MRTKLTESGIGLIETIAALAIGVVVITSLVSLSVFSLRASIQSKLLLQSSKLSAEELERVRAYRDSRSWSAFLTEMDAALCFSQPCHVTSALTVSPGTEVFDEGTPTQISRSFQLYDPLGGGFDGDETLIRTSVSVAWTIGGKTQSAHTYTDLSNWREQ